MKNVLKVMDAFKKIFLNYKYFLFGFVGLIVTLLLFVYFFFFIKTESVITKTYYSNSNNKQINKASTVQSANSSITNKEFFVDIKGEVLQPQVLKLSKKLIIQEVIELAGGLTENADTSQLNLSAEVSNGQMILIPNKNKIENNDENVNNEFRKININTANLNELQNIPGIGEIKAKLILDYRLKKGLFKSINDLSNISGFGEKTISRLSEYISV